MNVKVSHNKPFHNTIKSELSGYLNTLSNQYPENELLRIDLHCHDHNSNVPDELLGRILNVPETWLPTDNLLMKLKLHGADVFTITNHNNARSCFDLLDKGIDVLVGAEFSCFIPDFKTGIHVLTYGFSPFQETKLNKLRKNLYAFLEYASAENIPTIWAHPLYYYKSSGRPPLSFYDTMALLFERFEVINGQRDTWQNLLVWKWVSTLTKEKIEELSFQTGISPSQFCRNPYKKNVSGGSDSHMGIFPGLTGTLLHVPDLEDMRSEKALSELALTAIRDGRMVPFGGHQSSERMMVTFLDYVCQIAMYGKDPGLMRILLHKGDFNDKTLAMLVSNGFAELRRHKVTMNFIQLFHESMTGQEPHFSKRWFISKPYKPVFDEVKKMARSFREKLPEGKVGFEDPIHAIYRKLLDVLMSRIHIKVGKYVQEHTMDDFSLEMLMNQMELPSEMRKYLEGARSNRIGQDPSVKAPDIRGFLDGLSFPFLASSLILSAQFTSRHVLFKSRQLLDEFSEKLGYLQHPKRMLWLTDTFGDRNGVSHVLLSVLKVIREKDLPIDILTCSNDLESGDHLVVLKPVAEFAFPFYRQQSIRIPDFLELDKLFMDGEYDRVMCSTEGPMGIAALYLKHAFTVPAFFYLHTDWITFGKRVLNFDKDNSDRFRRLMRLFYRQFDKLFVLNKDQLRWLTGRKMEIPEQAVKLTAHWVEPCFHVVKSNKMEAFGLQETDKVLLFVGRISNEKGVMELPIIYEMVKKQLPDIRIVIAGTGPAENDLKEALPEAVYLGWVGQELLAKIYSAADLFVLPSRFDTFGMAVLESISCGLPVVTYLTKGPKDILQDGVNGYLVKTLPAFISAIVAYFRENSLQPVFRKAAVRRSREYKPERIMNNLLADVGLKEDSISGISVAAYD